MTAIITNALKKGFTNKQIIDFLIKKFPESGDKIKSALASGFTINQVLGFLTGGKKALAQMENEPLSEVNTEHAKTREADFQTRNTTEKGVMTAAALAGGALASPMAANALSRALPATLQGLIPGSEPPGQADTLAEASSASNTLQMPQSSPPSDLSPLNEVETPNSLSQPVNNEQQKIEPLTQKDKAYKDLIDWQNESKRLFDLAKQPKLSKESNTPFMRMAKQLIKKGDIKDVEQFNEFRKYWDQTEGQKRDNPFIEFEKFRFTRPQYQESLPTEENPAIAEKSEQNEQDFGNLREKISQRDLSDLDLKTELAKYSTSSPLFKVNKIAKEISYEKPRKDLTPEQAKNFQTIDNAINKTAEFLISGKGFTELLESRKGELWSEKNKQGIVLSTAEDVLRHLGGMESKYNLLTPQEQEETFETFTGLTPNLIWNTISLIDPDIQKIGRPINPKGPKKGASEQVRKEMTPNDFRRFLGHAVFKTLSVLEQHGDRAKMIISATDAIDSFRNRKMQKANQEIEQMDDETLNALLAAIDEQDIKKYR